MSGSELENYDSNSEVSVIFAISDFKGFIALQFNCAIAEQTQAGFQAPIKKTGFDLFRLRYSAAADSVKTESIRFLETFLAEEFSCGTANDVVPEYIEEGLKWDRILNAVVKRVIASPLFKRLVARLIKKHVDSVVDEICLIELFFETWNVIKASVPLSQVELPQVQQKGLKIDSHAEAENMETVSKKGAHMKRLED